MHFVHQAPLTWRASKEASALVPLWDAAAALPPALCKVSFGCQLAHSARRPLRLGVSSAIAGGPLVFRGPKCYAIHGPGKMPGVVCFFIRKSHANGVVTVAILVNE